MVSYCGSASLSYLHGQSPTKWKSSSLSISPAVAHLSRLLREGKIISPSATWLARTPASVPSTTILAAANYYGKRRPSPHVHPAPDRICEQPVHSHQRDSQGPRR